MTYSVSQIDYIDIIAVLVIDEMSGECIAIENIFRRLVVNDRYGTNRTDRAVAVRHQRVGGWPPIHSKALNGRTVTELCGQTAIGCEYKCQR